MRLFTQRLIGMLVLTAVLTLVSAPTMSFDALGQESDDCGTTLSIATEAPPPTNTAT